MSHLSDSNGTKPREWKPLPLRGCGTNVGGEWEAAGKRAANITMPDVRLLNRLVHYLATSNEALELKSERNRKNAKVTLVVIALGDVVLVITSGSTVFFWFSEIFRLRHQGTFYNIPRFSDGLSYQFEEGSSVFKGTQTVMFIPQAAAGTSGASGSSGGSGGKGGAQSQTPRKRSSSSSAKRPKVSASCRIFSFQVFFL